MDPEQLYQRGFDLRCNGQYAEARQILGQVISLSPNHVDAAHQLALIKGFEGDFDGSLADLAAIAQRVPGNLNVRYDLAMTQMMLGMFEEACANFRQILAVDPNHDAKKQVIYC